MLCIFENQSEVTNVSSQFYRSFLNLYWLAFQKVLPEIKERRAFDSWKRFVKEQIGFLVGKVFAFQAISKVDPISGEIKMSRFLGATGRKFGHSAKILAITFALNTPLCFTSPPEMDYTIQTEGKNVVTLYQCKNQTNTKFDLFYPQ